MSQHADEPHDEEFGPEIFRCRPLPPMKWVAAQAMGNGFVFAWIALPFGILPFFAMWPSMGAAYLVQDAAPPVKFGVFFACFIPIYAALFWLVYLQPRGDHLIVFQRGISVKITFKWRDLFFDELSGITFGLESATYDAFVGGLRWVRPGQAASLAGHGNAAINFYFKDGGKTVFKSFLLRFEPEDTQRFLDYLAEHHPRLFD